MREGITQNTFICPGCEVSIRYFPKVKIKTALETTFVSDENIQRMEDQGYLISPEFKCPQCECRIQVYYRVEIVEVIHLLPGWEPLPNSNPPDSNEPPVCFTKEEQEILEACASSGLVEALADAWYAQTGVKLARGIHRFFLRFLSHVERMDLPKYALDEFTREFPGQIEFWHSSGVGMVLSDGEISRFVPMNSMRTPKANTPAMRIQGVKVGVQKGSFEYIQRTKVGYVPTGARIFLESLRHATGDKGRTMQAVPIKGK